MGSFFILKVNVCFCMKALKNKIIKINDLLAERFGIPKRNKNLPDPVDMLIATILSQNTNDKNSYQAFQKLKSKYSSWELAAAAPLEDIEDTIRIAGLGAQKSKAIKNALNSILEKNGTISFHYFNDASR